MHKTTKENRVCDSLLLSGYQDSNLGPPAPKAGALTGLRYTPNALALLTFASAKIETIFYLCKNFAKNIYFFDKIIFLSHQLQLQLFTF